VFNYASNKCKHLKVCRVKKERDGTAIVVAETQSSALHPNINTVTGKTHQTHIQNLNGDNIEHQTNNTQIINLVVYNSKDGDSIQFNHSHIDPMHLKRFLIPGDDIQPDRLSGVVRQWTDQLLSNSENKCVKKTNIRSSHSKVHVGNNIWESRLDKEVYPNLMNNIANDFSDFFNDNYRRSMYKGLEAFIDYMASDGYCANDSDKRIENSYKTLVKELKLRTFDQTKSDEEHMQLQLGK
jgi:hypothetical protein